MSKWYSKGLPVASVSFLDNNRPCGSATVAAPQMTGESLWPVLALART